MFINFNNLETLNFKDLKPSNLLIKSNGKIKVSDFGLSRYYGSPDALLSKNVATLFYRAVIILFYYFLLTISLKFYLDLSLMEVQLICGLWAVYLSNFF